MANISKIKAVELILKEVEKGATHNDCQKLILSNFDLTKQSFTKYWKEAKAKYEARQKKVEIAKTSHEIKRAIHALETKEGQVISLIKQIDDLEKDLSDGFVTDARWVSDILVHDKRPMLDKEKVEKVALIAKLKADIRKILGLDAVKNHNVNINADINALLMAGDLTPEDSKEDTGKDLKQIEG